MVFSSFIFLYFFLPAFLLCYFACPSRWKNAVILFWSYLFYAWGAPKLVGLFFISCVIDYVLGRAIGASAYNLTKKRFLLSVSLIFNVGALFYYKYANFFIGEFERALSGLGFPQLHWAAIVLPIGISFFTFHKISYIIDVYRGVVKPCANFINYALYVALFPQLIAGPIIRYHDVSDQIENRRHDIGTIFDGVCRFCLGLGKKVLIADVMGNVADQVFHLRPDQLDTGYAWLGIVAYAFQIYFDFSGYSDMAIGLGKVMGFHFLENFDQPYISQNFTEFWRRWHISLSRWMRDYLYIPLGGNRVSKLRNYLNLWVVFFLSGLWHGANWTFIVWGLFHGFFLVIDKLFWIEKSKRISPIFNTIITFVLVLISWVFFRSDSIGQAFDYLSHMFNVVAYWDTARHVPRALVIHNQAVFIFILASALCFLPCFAVSNRVLVWAKSKLTFSTASALRFAGALACLILATLSLSTTNFTPFIYFRF